MKKSIKIIAGITAAVLSFGIVGCSKDTGATYPNFINGEAPPVIDETSEKYTVNVLSEGGLQLDGVRVLVKKNGEILKRVITNGGKAEIALPLNEYDIEVDESTLPVGYHMPEGVKYKTNAASREEVTIRIPSKLLGANETCGYRVGDIMKDFSFRDYSGESHRLSEVLSTKKVVILNFWYINCPNCDQEFPAIQRAYSSRSDVEIFAINPYDSTEDGAEYQKEKNLTFPMGEDRLNLSSSFNVSGYPTTVVIDRYGLIAASHSGGQPDMSYWVNLFNIYTASNYTQYLIKDDGSGGNTTNPDLIKPDVEMPNTTAMAQAANKDGFTATYRADTNEYVWPWLVGEDENGNSYVYSSNSGKGDTYAILYADFEMNKDEVLTFEYFVDSEAGRDVLMVMVNGILVSGSDGWSASEDWQTAYVYVAEEETEKVELALVFSKDTADPDGFNKKDMAMVREIGVTDKSVFEGNPMDVMRPVARNANPTANKYDSYVKVTETACEDGFYHIGDANGPLLFMTISNITPWSELHTGNYHQDEENSFYNTLYNMTFYNYAEMTENDFKVAIGDLDITDILVTNWTIQMYMTEPYYLIPVTEDLRNWAEAFVRKYEENLGLPYRDEEWLEFCYYFQHYGSDNFDHGVDAEGNKIECTAIHDRTRGLSRQNCYQAYEKGHADLSTAEMYNEETGRLITEMNFPMQPNNGTYFSFTPTKSGVYKIRSYQDKHATQNASPGIMIYDKDGNRLDGTSSVRDHEAKKGLGDYKEGDFAHYYTATEGETVYLFLLTTPATTGYYEFEIEYVAPAYEKMFIASTGDGIWGGNNGETYAAIPVALDIDSGYYYKADSNGDPILEQPIYIDFVFESCMYSDIPGCTFKPLGWLIENKYFADLDGGANLQRGMEYYLEQSKQGNTQDELYGLIPAEISIVETINKFIDRHIDGGRGTGNGWLMFACYNEKFGN